MSDSVWCLVFAAALPVGSTLYMYVGIVKESHSRGMSGTFSENVRKESSPFNHALLESR